MNGSLFSITRYMNRVCFKVSGGTSVPKLPPSYPPPPPRAANSPCSSQLWESTHAVWTLVSATCLFSLIRVLRKSYLVSTLGLEGPYVRLAYLPNMLSSLNKVIIIIIIIIIIIS